MRPRGGLKLANRSLLVSAGAVTLPDGRQVTMLPNGSLPLSEGLGVLWPDCKIASAIAKSVQGQLAKSFTHCIEIVLRKHRKIRIKKKLWVSIGGRLPVYVLWCIHVVQLVAAFSFV